MGTAEGLILLRHPSVCRRRLDCVIPAPRLQLEPSRAVQRDLQPVKPAVKLLRRKAQNVDKFGNIRRAPEALIQIIVVVKENSAGATGEVEHHAALRLGFGAVKLTALQIGGAA